MTRTALLVCLLALAWPAGATDYYICNCDTGAEGGCTNGSTSNDGLSSGAPKQTLSDFTSLMGGAECADRILLCEGGRWTANSLIGPLSSEQSCVGDHIILDSYDPTGSFTQRPRFQRTSGTSDLIAFGFGGSGPFNGLTINNIEFYSDTPAAGRGIFFQGAADTNGPFTLYNVLVRGFSANLEIGGTDSILVDVQESDFIDSPSTGVIGGPASNSVFINNLMDNNGHGCNPASTCGGTHNWYLGTDKATTGLVIRGNTISNSCQVNGGACTCNTWAFRGCDGCIVEDNNLIEIDTGGTRSGSFQCNVRFSQNSSNDEDGIQNAFVRRNTFIGLDEVQFCGTRNTVIENNVIAIPDQDSFQADPPGKQGIKMANAGQCGGGGTGDTVSDNNTIRNNSVYTGAGVEATCLSVEDDTGTSHELTGNVCHMDTPGTGDSYCFRINSGSQWVTDYNVCYRNGGSSSYGRIGASAQTLAQWRTALGGCAGAGNECAGLDGSDPLFTDVTPPTFDLTIGSSSPAKDIADGSESALFAAEDFLEVARPQNSNFDAGAYELSGGGGGGSKRRVIIVGDAGTCRQEVWP